MEPDQVFDLFDEAAQKSDFAESVRHPVAWAYAALAWFRYDRAWAQYDYERRRA